MIELIVKRDDREINRYFLPQGQTTLGRAEDNAIILDDSAVSRRHARIKVDGIKVSIEDLGSGNGTFYGDNRIERQDLTDGDEIVIEPFRLLLRKDKEGVVKDSTRPVPASRPPPMSRLDAPPSKVKRDPGGSAAGGPRLEVVRGQGGPYLLTGENSSIGRSEDATITLKDPSSSRKHASIEKTNRGWICADLGSANGTYVNGASVKEAELQDGDIILIGNTELRFVDPGVVAADDDEPDVVSRPMTTRPVPKSGARKPAPAPVSEMEMEMELGGSPDSYEDQGQEDAYDEPAPPPPRSARGGNSGSGRKNPNGGRNAGNGGAFEGGGAMPQDEAPGGGTEFGPPPSAFGESTGTDGGEPPMAFGDAPTGYGNDDYGTQGGYNDAGYGMELGDDALFPGGQRPPDSLLGKYIFSLKTNRKTQIITAGLAVVFVIVLMGGSGKDGGGGGSGAVACIGGEDLDKQQNLNLNTIERFEKDIELALARTPTKDYATAFERYGRIVAIGRNDSMANVCVAQDKTRIALESLFALHEFLVIQKLREVTVAGATKDAATEARIAKNTKQGFDSLTVARRRRSTDQYKRAIAAFENVLEDDPGNSAVKAPLDEARREYRALVGEISEAQLERLTAKCKGIYAQGVQQQAKRTASAYQQAIKTFERITRREDPDGRTVYYPQAQSAISAGKRKLRELASPLRAEGKKYSSTQDWLRARVALRKAVATDPFDQTLQAELDAVQNECIRNAKRQISEAKAYEAAVNYPESLKSAALGLKYADRDTDKENQQIKEIIKRIRRNSER